MDWIFCVSIGFLLTGVIILGIAILRAQNKLDAPYKGVLLVDKQEENERAMVYLEVLEDPNGFKDGELVKMRVHIIESDRK